MALESERKRKEEAKRAKLSMFYKNLSEVALEEKAKLEESQRGETFESLFAFYHSELMKEEANEAELRAKLKLELLNLAKLKNE